MGFSLGFSLRNMFSTKQADAAPKTAVPPPPSAATPHQAGPGQHPPGLMHPKPMYPDGFYTRRADSGRAIMFRTVSPDSLNGGRAAFFPRPAAPGLHAGAVHGGPHLPPTPPDSRASSPASTYRYSRPQTPAQPSPQFTSIGQFKQPAPQKKRSAFSKFAQALGLGRTYSWNERRHNERMDRAVPISLSLKSAGKKYGAVALHGVTQRSILRALDAIENEHLDPRNGKIARMEASPEEVMKRVMADVNIKPLYEVNLKNDKSETLGRKAGERWGDLMKFSENNPGFEALQTTILELKHYNKPLPKEGKEGPKP